MPWNHKTTRRDRKRRNTPRCRGLNRVHVVHFDDAEKLVDRLAYRAIRWPVRCIVCGRIIHHSPIFSWADSLSGGPFVSGGPARWFRGNMNQLSRRQRRRFARYIEHAPRTTNTNLADFLRRVTVEFVVYDDPPTPSPMSAQEIDDFYAIVRDSLEPKTP